MASARGMAPNNRRANRRMIGVLVAMVAAWGAVMLCRNTIRAYWWGHKVRSGPDAAQRVEYVARLTALGGAALPVAVNLLHDDSLELRGYGVFLLSRLDSPESADRLLAATGDSDPDIRRLALQAYAQKDTPDVIPTLERLLDDDRADVAMLAMCHLTALCPDEALPTLIDAARSHPAPALRVQAVQLLGKSVSPRAVDVLIECLGDTTAYSGRTAIEDSALRSLQARPGTASAPGDDRLVPAFHVVGEEAAQALQAITGRSFEYQWDDAESRAAAIRFWRQWRNTAPPE